MDGPIPNMNFDPHGFLIAIYDSKNGTSPQTHG
jgi:hypothetical protein